jgi:hypothetical protein
MPTTMLLRLAVVPTRLLIVAEPLVVLPARLNVIGLLVCAKVGVPPDSGTLPPLIAGDGATVVGLRRPELVLVTTIPATTHVLAVLTTEVSCAGLLVFQLPVVLHVVGSVKGVLVFPLLGPTASELPLKVRVAFDEIVIDELLTLLTVAPLGMP